ncbi:BMC domain-containing protein [Pseudanabaena sp. FACHB-2040]|uniref:carbon dioxide-concentrating mechanism protein CcmK n=1 Tax=Pseudanabaena sp. FACHB-2040 TaxID=2692859 RepID=UPI00168331CC|nr:BMC domain-containing protein [Pseudanabaena sp. FACHB-2040]MBD0334319.1 BMC domain-containing protein [Cyanobacteria bacterium Co-bin13]MBD2258936.1 BMC domain-containing protein [Pseudanabaena sp. FACHB-2040]
MQSDFKLALTKQAAAKQELKLASPPNLDRGHRLAKLQGAALGLVSTESFPAVVGTADAMLKSADVFLVGYEKTGGGQCTAVVRGGVADVRMAVAVGVETAAKFGEYVSSTVIPRPLPNLEAVLPICAKLDELTKVGRGRSSNQAIGLLETRGFPAMVGAADAMTKSAEVTLVAHETIGDGLCTIIIRGSLPNVAIAIEAGIHEAERIGELHAVMVIPRPLDELEQSLPQMAEELEPEQPIRLPLNLEDKEKELVALPEPTAEPMVQEIQLPELEKLPLQQPEDS